MVELSEIALENVVGGKVPKCVKEFAEGLRAPYVTTCNMVHDVVASEKNIKNEWSRATSVGILVGMASMSAISIGVHEGVKFIRRKIKGRK